MMASTEALRFIAPHVIGASDILHVADDRPGKLYVATTLGGGSGPASPDRPRYEYRCSSSKGIEIRAPFEARVPWSDIVDLIRLGTTPEILDQLRTAYAAHCTASGSDPIAYRALHDLARQVAADAIAALDEPAGQLQLELA